MAKSSGGIRGRRKETPDIQTVKKGLMVAGRFNSSSSRWNNNSQYNLGLQDDAQLVIDDIAKGDSFAAKVAQSVKQYNYRISEKQAYVIAKEAVEKRNKFLYSKDNKTLKMAFTKSPEYGTEEYDKWIERLAKSEIG